MPYVKKPSYPVERLDEIRALGPHMSYSGLLQWFMRLPAAPYVAELPPRKRASDAAGTNYDVALFRRQISRELASVCLDTVENDPDLEPTRIFFRGIRRLVFVRDQPGARRRIESREVRSLDDPTVALAWRETDYNRLDLKALGANAGGTAGVAPMFATVITPDNLTVSRAEELLLQAGTAFTHPQPVSIPGSREGF